MLKLLQDLKPLYERKSVNLGMKNQKKMIENGQHGTVKQNPEVQLNSSMDTIFYLVFAQGLLKQSYGAQETTITNNYVSKSTPIMKEGKKNSS